MSYANRYGFGFYLPDITPCTPKDDMFFRRSGEWVPFTSAGHAVPYTNGVKYPRIMGVLPKYGGHVPGEIFSVGYTFGRATIDARRWLVLHQDV